MTRPFFTFFIGYFLGTLSFFPLTAQKTQTFTIPNPSQQQWAPAVFSYPIKLTKKTFVLRNSQQQKIPAYYHSKKKKILFLDSLAASGETYTIFPKERALTPEYLWKFESDFEKWPVRVGRKKIKRPSASIQNGMFVVKILRSTDIRSKVEIRSLQSNYRLQFTPLGMSQGCLEKEKQAEKLDAEIAAGKTTNPQIFSIYAGTATKITLKKPNPFQRTLFVKCLSMGIKNNGQSLNLFSRSDYEITLTWNSPIIKVKSYRTLRKKYYNHNGVNLNEVFLDQSPILIQSDKAKDFKEISPKYSGGYDIVAFDKFMKIKDLTGQTILYQPDFKTLGIRDPCVAILKDRIMTVISHSWHQGWKPIEQEPREYNDTIYFICDIGASKKTLKTWITELATSKKIENK